MTRLGFRSLAQGRLRLRRACSCIAISVLGLGSACGDDGQCTGSLAEVGAGCQPSFDGKLESFPDCQLWTYMQMAYRCDDLIVFTTPSLGGTACYYSVGTHKLVGAVMYSDVPTFCDNSFDKSAGRTPSRSCTGTVDLVQRDCLARSPIDAGP